MEVGLQKEKKKCGQLIQRMDFGMSLPAPPRPFFPPSHSFPGDWVTWTLLLPALQSMVQTMELWVQLKQAGLEPLGLGPLPQALRMPLPEGNPGQTLMSSGTELGGAREPLLWIWEELVSARAPERNEIDRAGEDYE